MAYKQKQGLGISIQKNHKNNWEDRSNRDNRREDPHSLLEATELGAGLLLNISAVTGRSHLSVQSQDPLCCGVGKWGPAGWAGEVEMDRGQDKEV